MGNENDLFFLFLFSFQRSIAKTIQVIKTDGNKVEVQLAQYFTRHTAVYSL